MRKMGILDLQVSKQDAVRDTGRTRITVCKFSCLSDVRSLPSKLIFYSTDTFILAPALGFWASTLRGSLLHPCSSVVARGPGFASDIEAPCVGFAGRSGGLSVIACDVFDARCILF